MGACQVSVTAGTPEEARRVVDVLLERRLAACVQVVGPVESHFWWEGTRRSATEWLCLVKTGIERVDDVVAAVRAVHSYDVPEIVAVPIVGGDPDYVTWIGSETSGPPTDR